MDEVSLAGAIAAGKEKLIVPVLVGLEHKICAAAKAAKLDFSGYELVPTEHSHAAAAQAVALAVDLVFERRVNVDREAGNKHEPGIIRTIDDKDMAHASCGAKLFPMDNRTHEFVSLRAAFHQCLDLVVDIVQIAIDLARALGIALPKVAILSAVESVPPKIKSTLDAAALCKMADRRQITGGTLDGPLALDYAVSAEAAKTKGIISPVPGQADIFVVPVFEAGNMMAKQLEYLAEAEIAGIVLGARVPIILTSRADKTLGQLGSCAVALLLARHTAEVKP